MSAELTNWQKFIGCNVVVDTTSSYVYLGRLKEVSDWFVTLEDADVHDQKESYSSKEYYIIEAKKYGIKANRKNVAIRKDVIVSISLLEDVIEY